MTLPSDAERNYAQSLLTRRRQDALKRLLTAEHVDAVANMVCSYNAELDESSTPEGIAYEILTYLAHEVVEPLTPAGSE